MTQALAQKMYLIAKQVNDLNAKAKVKAQTGNEKGYAKLFSINSGCRVWAHHTHDDKLIVDLMYTASAEDKHPDLVKVAVATFEQLAKDSGYLVSQSQWEHSIDKSKRTQFFLKLPRWGTMPSWSLSTKSGSLLEPTLFSEMRHSWLLHRIVYGSR